MAITVARIPYLGCEPFYYDMERRGIETRNMASNLIASALLSGEIDSGPVPLADCARLEEGFQPLSGFCVALVSPTGASVLHTKVPINELKGLSIVIPEAASPLKSMLRILLTLKHQVDGVTFADSEDAGDSHDALLLVDNQALRRRRGVRGFPHKYDLGEEWREWTGLPFIYYRWMVRSDMGRRDAVILEDSLYVGQEDWLDNLYRMSGPRDDLLMLPKDVLEHIQSLRYYMGVPEQKAIDLFNEQMKSLEPEGKQ